MTRRAYVYFVLTFLLGAVLGGASMFIYGWYSGRWHRHFDKQHIVRHLTRELSLSQTQVQQLSQIVDDYAKKRADLQNQVEPQFAALREEQSDGVRRILTPEQVTKFNELVRRWNERRKKRQSP